MIDKIKTAQSVNGKEIPFYELKSQSLNAKNIFVLGVFHGDEIEGEYMINKLMQEIEDNALYFNNNIYFLPCLNSDGKELKTRTNANKVDLNRNYPTKNFCQTSNHYDGRVFAAGKKPASEPETRFMISLVEEYQPIKIISIHSDLHCVDYDGPAKEIAKRYSDLSGYKLVDEIGYGTLGSFGTWAGIEKQIPLITLETWGAKSKEDLETIWQENKAALIDFIDS